MKKIKISIAGGTGYTAGELLRILYAHPHAEITSVSSTTRAGEPIYNAHPDLEGIVDINFSDKIDKDVDVIFLCLGHGISSSFLENLGELNKALKIIDLSNDFRLNKDQHFLGRTFIYGLPELNREAIKIAENIANPGCFATAIQLALLPLAEKNILNNDVHISAITGSTGAGAKPMSTTHFSWRNNNVSTYKAFTHQHLGEISESLQQLQSDFDSQIHFIPMRGNFARGIFTNIYTPTTLSQEEATQIYTQYYESHPFVQVTGQNLSMKQAVNTNRCFIQIQVIDGKILIHSAIDNLIKGASGQAVQNMNLMFGLPETTGLNLKPTML